MGVRLSLNTKGMRRVRDGIEVALRREVQEDEIDTHAVETLSRMLRDARAMADRLEARDVDEWISEQAAAE